MPAIQKGDILKDAKGVIIIDTVDVGCVLSGTQGSGVVMAKNADGSWSAPSAVTITSVKLGLVVGAKNKGLIFVFDQDEAVDKFLGAFRFLDEVPADAYAGQVNDAAVMSFDTAVGIGVRADLDEETAYTLTKTFWDNIDQVTSEAPWAKALSVEFAASKRGVMELHPGAARYYREVGVLD